MAKSGRAAFQPAQPPEQRAFLSWEEGDERSRALAMAECARGLAKAQPVLRSHGSNVFQNILPGNVSVRDGMDRADYEDFRRGEALPKKPREVIRACLEAYDEVGLIRNVIDFMGDFATQGIDLVHEDEAIEKWHKEWFKKVNGKDRSERFLNLLFRGANVVGRRWNAQLKLTDEREMSQAAEGPDVELPAEDKGPRRLIPMRYTFYNPLSVEPLDEEESLLLGEPLRYGVNISAKLAGRIKNPRTDADRKLAGKIPKNTLVPSAMGGAVVPLPEDKTFAFYYKRDDWNAWAKPFLAPLLSEINLLKKMKLADLAALDGAISSIRVWKLGSLEDKILPSEATILRLAEMLVQNVGGGVLDLVWGPAIDLLETSTDVHHFLGETKYAPVLRMLYGGLGVPPVLTGETGGGFTNNFLSLRTLTERLRYARDVLGMMWRAELKLVQKGMRFDKPAKLVYERMSLTDENAEKALLIQLLDRAGVSLEYLQENFGADPEIERVRMRREQKLRESGELPPRASAFFEEGKFATDLKKIFAQTGVVTPSQVGLDLPKPKDGEVPAAKMATDQKKGPKGESGEGRPPNKKDSAPRKQKEVNPRASLFVHALARAENVQEQLGRVLAPAYLKVVEKKSLRELTGAEGKAFEDLRFALLANLPPEQVPTQEWVKLRLQSPLSVPQGMTSLLAAAADRYLAEHGRHPPLEVVRRFQASAYALAHADFGEEVV